MLSYTYLSPGKFGLIQKPKPVLRHDRDAIVRVTLSSICTSDLHIKHGTVPRAIPGVTVGHEMVGIVESVGAEVSTVKPGVGQRGDLLRHMFLLPTRICQQLHRSQRRLGTGVSN